MKRVITYGRTSTKDQSSELQFREMDIFVERRGWHLVQQIQDTATGTNLKRIGFQEVLKQCRARKTDVVLVWKLDRAFRSLKDCINTLQEFTELGVEFVSMKDNLDLTTSAGRLMLHVIAAFAAFEADIIKERVRAGLDNARAKGKVLGRPPKLNFDDLIKLREQGLTLSQISQRTGTTKGAVSKSLSKGKIKRDIQYHTQSLSRPQTKE